MVEYTSAEEIQEFFGRYPLTPEEVRERWEEEEAARN